MILIKTTGLLRDQLTPLREKNCSIGFVPTMGALHEGHISLVKECKARDGYCVSSIFVNPTQFNNAADFDKYPSTITGDLDKLEAAGCDLVFLPTVAEIYPPGYTAPHYELGYLENILEGKYRPGHYQGVCQVVDILLAIVQPQNLYLGQKDYQQCMVLAELVKIKKYATAVRVCPTVREKDGLAMSSRNLRLNPEERKQALAISQALLFIQDNIRPGKLAELKAQMTVLLEEKGFRVDYVEIADAGSLVAQEEWDGKKPLVALVAAYLNEIRLIDNMKVGGAG